jgi:SIR2-like domain
MNDRHTWKRNVFILGAGFSVLAGYPTAKVLWDEVRKRIMSDRNLRSQFESEIEFFREYKRKALNENTSAKEIGFEEFMTFLDVEHYLRLKGTDTFSVDGNKIQVNIKFFIGQILSQCITQDTTNIPQKYFEFVDKIKDGDTVITFNYDTLLEQILKYRGRSFRYKRHIYDHVYPDGGGAIDLNADDKDIIILKVHGSINWYENFPDYKKYILSKIKNIDCEPLVAGPSSADDPLKDTVAIKNLEEFYRPCNQDKAIPLIINPSSIKISYIGQKIDFFSGIDRNYGQLFEKVIIVGYSLPKHDSYARQVIFNLTNSEGSKLIYCSLAKDMYEKIKVKKNWRMLKQSTTKWHLGGFETFPTEWI